MKKTSNYLSVSLFVMPLLLIISPVTVFAYQAAPIAISKQALFITEKSAKLNGQANPSEMPDAYAWFEWGISGRPGVVYETTHQSVSSWYGNTLTDTSADIVGLAPSTQYFYRQIVENGRGKDVGQTLYFTTKVLVIGVPPLVIAETDSPSAVGETTVTLRGYVSPHGDTTTKAWFDWGTSQRLEGQTSKVGVSSNANFFESALSSLTPGTTYFYRIVAENFAGRTYGAIRILNTAGPPPPPPEAQVSQAIPPATVGGDGVARTTSSSGVYLATNQGSSVAAGGITSQNFAGDLLASLFRKKTTTATPQSDTADSVNTSMVNDPSAQVASVATAGGPLGAFWNALMGSDKKTAVQIEKIGPTNVSIHTPVEYRITYQYGESSVATGAKLKIIIPFDVVYIGDNTNNELLLEDGSGGERTYVLPIGRLEKGGTRVLSILGMTTGSAKGFPDARARLEFQQMGATRVVSSGGTALAGAKGSTGARANTAGAGNGMLPSSFVGWILYLIFVVLAIIGVRKGIAYYRQKKASIEAMEQEEDGSRLARMLPSVGGTPR